MRKNWLPKGGTNLFQEIKQKCREAEANGKKLIKLSIGQPSGAALFSARKATAKAIMSEEESMHEYQDNSCLPSPDFAKRFVQAHVKCDFEKVNVDFLPTPGTKPMLGLIPMACGGIGDGIIVVRTTTDPGYPTPKGWCDYLGVEHCSLRTDVENQFCFGPNDISSDTNLIMVNYPHNPSGQIATREWWEKICKYCESNGIRIFNDAAYAMLTYANEAFTLSEVAVNFPNLSWAEAFSSSKIGNFTGWRVGAICGSSDFIGDIKTIKGNTDSGFNAALAIGVLHAVESDKVTINIYCKLYQSRLETLINILSSNGMQLAVQPGAGFFTLWKVPKIAFGQKISSAQHFNFLMIEKTGVVGVHFDPYIRYAVVGPIEEYKEKINIAFKEVQVSY